MADLLSTRQVAAMLNVSSETVSRWAYENKITASRTPGGHWRFRREDVEAFLPIAPEPVQ